MNNTINTISINAISPPRLFASSPLIVQPRLAKSDATLSTDSGSKVSSSRGSPMILATKDGSHFEVNLIIKL